MLRGAAIVEQYRTDMPSEPAPVGDGPTTTVPVTTTVAPAAFCPLAVAYVQDPRNRTLSMTDPPKLRGLVQHASPAMAQSAAAAPPEVKADVALLVTAIAQYSEALETAGYEELAKLPPDMVMKLQSPQVMAAINHVDMYVRKAAGRPNPDDWTRCPALPRGPGLAWPVLPFRQWQPRASPCPGRGPLRGPCRRGRGARPPRRAG
jgi:hypothetical protein